MININKYQKLFYLLWKNGLLNAKLERLKKDKINAYL